jgi:hypothetical protein
VCVCVCVCVCACVRVCVHVILSGVDRDFFLCFYTILFYNRAGLVI